MTPHRKIPMLAALVALGGSAYLATPATAEPVLGCSDEEWYAAASRANAACEGPSSFAGYCDSNGSFVITEIRCQSQY